MSKLYKTAQGKVIDIAALMMQNERVRAVGNMKVNAKGDTIDSHNRVISSRAQQVNKNLNKKTVDKSATQPTRSSAPKHSTASAKTATAAVENDRPTAPKQSMPGADVPQSGLAAALSKVSKTKEESK